MGFRICGVVDAERRVSGEVWVVRPKIRYLKGSWYVTGGLVPIDLRYTAHQSLVDAVEAVCQWLRGGADGVRGKMR